MLPAHLSMEDLSSDDDILSDILIDHLEWETPISTHKMSLTYRSARVDTNEVSSIVRKWCVEKQDVRGAVDQLCALKVVQRHLSPKSIRQQSAFRAHVQRYLECYLPNSGFEFALTMRYKQSPSAPLRSRRHKAIVHLQGVEAGTSSRTGSGNEALSNGTSHIHHRMDLPPLIGSDDESPRTLLAKADLCVLATHELSIGDILHACRGGIADLTKDEDEQLRGDAAHQRSIKHHATPTSSSSGTPPTSTGVSASNQYRSSGPLGAGRDFSVIRSARKGCSQLFLGPARFVNHDCEPNVELYRIGNQMTFRCIRPIHVNEEVVTYYGDNYFGWGNAECLCATCEARQAGAFAPADTDTNNADIPSPDPSASAANSNDDHVSASVHESIAERASKRHSVAAQPVPLPPNPASEHLNLDEVKYAPGNSDTKDGHITRKLLDEPEALMENAGGGNKGPERECVTCRAHFWSKESWWKQEECSRCERHYKIFKADWPGRVPTEGLIARSKGKKPLQRLDQIREAASPRVSSTSKVGPSLSTKNSLARVANVPGNASTSRLLDVQSESRDGTPVVLTPLRASENPDYASDRDAKPPPSKRRKTAAPSARGQAGLATTQASGRGSPPTTSSAPPQPTDQTRRSSRTPTPRIVSTSSTASSTGSITSATATVRGRGRTSTPESLGRSRGADTTTDSTLHDARPTADRSAKVTKSSKRPATTTRTTPGLLPDTTLEPDTTTIPRRPQPHESEDDSDPAWEGGSELGRSEEEGSHQRREAGHRPPTSKKARTSTGSQARSKAKRPLARTASSRPELNEVDSDASLSTGSSSSSSNVHKGPKMLGKHATTDALAMHWGATEDTGRFRRRTAQPPQPPQALFTYASGPTYRLDNKSSPGVVPPNGAATTKPRSSGGHRRTDSVASNSSRQHKRQVSTAGSDRSAGPSSRNPRDDEAGPGSLGSSHAVKEEKVDTVVVESKSVPSGRQRKKLRISGSQELDSVVSPSYSSASVVPVVPAVSSEQGAPSTSAAAAAAQTTAASLLPQPSTSAGQDAAPTSPAPATHPMDPAQPAPEVEGSSTGPSDHPARPERCPSPTPQPGSMNLQDSHPGPDSAASELDESYDSHKGNQSRGRRTSQAVDAQYPGIATQGAARTSFNNLSLAWTAGIGSKRTRKPPKSDPVLLVPQPHQARRSQGRSTTRSHSRSRDPESRDRQLTSPVPGTRPNRRTSPVPSSRGRASSAARETASPLVARPSPRPSGLSTEVARGTSGTTGTIGSTTGTVVGSTGSAKGKEKQGGSPAPKSRPGSRLASPATAPPGVGFQATAVKVEPGRELSLPPLVPKPTSSRLASPAVGTTDPTYTPVPHRAESVQDSLHHPCPVAPPGSPSVSASAPPVPNPSSSTPTELPSAPLPQQLRKPRRNLRWGKGKVSFARPSTAEPSGQPQHGFSYSHSHTSHSHSHSHSHSYHSHDSHDSHGYQAHPAHPHPDLSCPPELQAQLHSLVELSERNFAHPPPPPPTTTTTTAVAASDPPLPPT